MLRFNDVGIAYNNIPVFKNVSFEINQGDLVFITGKSGSGKSTLLQLIYINEKPDEGFIEFLNYSTEKIKKKELPFLRREIGIIFQDFKLLKDRNINDNLSFILEVTNVKKRERIKRINKVLTEVGLSHRRKSMPVELSGGEQQRIAIARAIINEPQLILADEPTGNLDNETSLEIFSLLKRINERGTTLIIATHNTELLNHVTKKRVLKIENGLIREL